MYNCVKGFSVSILLALTLTGCVTLPSGPSVMSLPGSGKSFDVTPGHEGFHFVHYLGIRQPGVFFDLIQRGSAVLE